MNLSDFILELRGLAQNVANLRTAYQEEQIRFARLKNHVHHRARISAGLARAYDLLGRYIEGGDLEALRKLRGLVKVGGL